MRFLLSDLQPGTAYVVRARSKNGSDFSNWSRDFSVSTISDTVAPKTPTNPVGSMNGTSFTLKWDAVTQSADNSAASDLDRYEVEASSTGSINTGVYVTKDTKFEFSFEQNANLFGTPQANVRMRVRAVDAAGNASAFTALASQTNPAPTAPTGFAGSAGVNSLSFTWNAVTDLDLKQYRIYSGTTSGTQGTLVWTGTALNATIQVTDTSTDRWYKVVSVDVFGTESASSNVVGPLKPNSPVTVDTVAPAVPTGLAGTLTNATDGKTASMAVTWTGVADSDLDSYVVAFRQQASPVNDWQYVTVDKATTSTTIQGLVPYTAHDIRIRAKDFSANYSAYSTIVAVAAQANTAPAVPTGLAVSAAKDNLQISWTENSELDMKNNAGTYDVTVATNSGFTTGVLQYRTGATTLSVNGLATNTQYWVRVRATDSGGLSSAYSASANATTSNFPTTALSDGAVPTGAVTLSASAGIGYIYLSWTPLVNADPVIYDVYMSTTNNFTTYDATTKITEVSGTSAFIDTLVGGATLAYGTTYYFKVRARDKDGSSASVSNQASAAPVQAASTDLTPAVNTSITNAQTAANNAQNTADTADALNANPNFSQWSGGAGTAPDSWAVWTNAPTKETTLVRTSPYSVRFNCTDTTTAKGIQQSAGSIPMAIGIEFVTLTYEVMLNSGASFGGAGFLLDWTGMTGVNRATLPISNDIAAPVTGKWYRVTKVVRRPTTATGTQTQYNLFIMGQYASVGSTPVIKDVVFNRVAVRPSTTEEIAAYNAAPVTMVNDLDARVASKATDLITNGSGLMGTNYNFPGFDYDSSDAPTGANGSFVIKTSANQSSVITENIPFDPTKAYKFSFQCRQTVATKVNNMYGFLAPFDAFNNSIGPQNFMYIANTTTTLAAPLNPGDTTITLTSAANWFGQTGKSAGAAGYLRNAIFWDYVDAGGKAWPTGTYSRNLLSPSAVSMWADGGITGNVITLSAPYAGTAKPAGTSLSNASAGGSYIYMPSATNVVVPETWTAYTDVFSGGIMAPATQAVATTGGASWAGGMPPGTAKIRVGWLLNYPGGGGKHAVAAVSLSDAAAAQATADGVKTDLATNYSTTTAMNTAITTSANGKNKTTYSASAPGTAANIAGDIWFQQDGTGKIMGQWIGAGGTSWTAVTLRNEIIASLDAGKIVAGSTFTNDLNVKSTFNLGDATTPGIIKSYNYAAGSAGFKLASNGLEIVDGIIDAKAIKANSSFVTNLFIGTGGAIQSTGFSGTTGFQLSTSGLIIRGAGNSVDVGAITAGTITGKQWIMGTGGSFIVDQTGYFQSNNYSATTGWKLDSTGLTINQGTIDAKTLKSSTIDTATITLSGANGKIVGTGFTLAGNGLTVTSGSISAPALQIQSGASNLMRPEYSAFEFTPSFYTGKFGAANGTPSIQASGGIQGGQFLRCTNITASAASINLADNGTDYNISVEGGKTYIFSAWMKASGATAQAVFLRPRWSDGTFGSSGGTTPTLSASGSWVRYSWVYTAPAGATSALVQAYNNSTTAGAGFDIDGVQVEQQIGGLTTPSTYVMPGMTSADGGFLRTGEIRSTANVTVNGASQPAWSINMSGGAQFGDAAIRGTLVVGPTTSTNLAPNGGTFESNVTGYTVYAVGGTGAALSRTTTAGELITGTGSMKIAWTTIPTKYGFSFSLVNGTVSPAGIPAGNVMKVTMKVRGLTTASIAGSDLVAEFLDSGNNVIYTTGSILPVPTYLQPNTVMSVNYNVVLPAGIANATTVRIYSNKTSVTPDATGVVYDDIVLSVGDDAGSSYISSGNFAQGDMGWKISSGGTAEFNNVTIRGGLQTASTGPRWQIGTTPQWYGASSDIISYSGSALEGTPAKITSYGGGIAMYGAKATNVASNPSFTLTNNNFLSTSPNTYMGTANLQASSVYITGQGGIASDGNNYASSVRINAYDDTASAVRGNTYVTLTSGGADNVASARIFSNGNIINYVDTTVNGPTNPKVYMSFGDPLLATYPNSKVTVSETYSRMDGPYDSGTGGSSYIITGMGTVDVRVDGGFYGKTSSITMTGSTGALNVSAGGSLSLSSGDGITTLTGNVVEQLMWQSRAIDMLTGGGVITVDTSYNIRWSQKFMVASLGRNSNLYTNGYLAIDMPPVGTVINGYGGAPSTTTVTSAGITMPVWGVLYYVPTFGTDGSTTDQTAWRMVGYSADFTVPAHWIPVAIRNYDLNMVYFGNGIGYTPWYTPTFTNSWVAFANASYQNPQYRRNSMGRVEMRGLMKSGTVNVGAFTLPAGFRPVNGEIFVTGASGGVADLRIFPTGEVRVSGYFAGGTNGSVSLAGVTFTAEN